MMSPKVVQRSEIIDSAYDALEGIVRLAVEIFDTPFAYIASINQEWQLLRAYIGLGLGRIPSTDPLCIHTIAERKPFVVADTCDADKFADSVLVRDFRIRFYAGISLTASGHTMGILGVLDRIPHQPTVEQVASLEILAHQMMALTELECYRQRQHWNRHSYEPPRLVEMPASSQIILLIERDFDLAGLAQKALSARGYRVLWASDLDQALEICDRHHTPIDLIVTGTVASDDDVMKVRKVLTLRQPGARFLFTVSNRLDWSRLRQTDILVIEKPFLLSSLVSKVGEALAVECQATET